jgi:hypothetical protein
MKLVVMHPMKTVTTKHHHHPLRYIQYSQQ